MGFGDVKLAAVMGLYLGWLGWTPTAPGGRPAAARVLRADARLRARRGVRARRADRHEEARRLPVRPRPRPRLLRRRALRLDRAQLAARLRDATRTRSSSRPPHQGVRSRWQSRRSAIRSPCGPIWRAWLAAQTGAGAVEVGEVSIPGLSGFSNETLLFEATWDGEVHPLVIRVEPTGHTVFPATAFDTQVQVMQALHAEGTVPVPEVLWFEEDPSILGARFVCMRRVDGRGARPTTPATTARAGCRPSRRDRQRRVWESGIDTMARIHQLDRAALGLGWIGDVDARRAARARSRVPHASRAATCPTRAVDRAFEILEATVPPADRPARPLLGRLAHRQHDLRRRPARRRGARLGDGHRRRSGAGPRLVPAARPPPRDGLRRDAPARVSRRARSRSLAGRRPAATRPSTSSGTSCSAPPATRRSWSG